MKTLVIGNGEIGSALARVLSKVYRVDIWDSKFKGVAPPIGIYDIMHICIPYSKNFVAIVDDYVEYYKPTYTINHSSVPVGTTIKINGNSYHSPVRGKHPNMEEGLYNYTKYLSYDLGHHDDMNALEEYFSKAGINIKMIPQTKTTELMKLLELCRYGVYIAFAKEQESICKHFGERYDLVVSKYEKSRNEGIVKCGMPELQQPVLYPFKDFVGGHCTVEDMELLLEQLETPLLKEAYEIDKATKVWGNTNIYSSAKIGKGCSIGQFCEIGHNVVIGNNVRIGAFSFIPEGVTIGEGCFIAPKVTFSNDKHPPSSKEYWGKIEVKKNATIGMGAIILPGVTIGENAVVGAGSIVTKDIPDGEVWYGNPAYPHGKKGEVYEK